MNSIAPSALLRRFSLVLAAFALLLTACSRDDGPIRYFSALPEDAVVLVLGDSLVYGTGASRESAWPQIVARDSGWDVINAGIPGNTSADALARLDDLLDQYQPNAVILAIGGNDFLRDLPEKQTRENLTQMIRKSQSVTTHVALVAIPAKSLRAELRDHALYADLASEHSVAMVPLAVSEVLSRQDLRSDRIHANERGYALIAERVIESLGKHGWMQN